MSAVLWYVTPPKNGCPQVYPVVPNLGHQAMCILVLNYAVLTLTRILISPHATF